MPGVAGLRQIADTFNGRGHPDSVPRRSHRARGCTAVEKALTDGGHPATVPFTPGRVDTRQELTDIERFTWLKPVVDGFRNYVADGYAPITSSRVSLEELFLDKAYLLSLTDPEWVALVGCLRALGANHDGSKHGIFTDRFGVLSNDFFVSLPSVDLV